MGALHIKALREFFFNFKQWEKLRSAYNCVWYPRWRIPWKKRVGPDFHCPFHTGHSAGIKDELRPGWTVQFHKTSEEIAGALQLGSTLGLMNAKSQAVSFQSTTVMWFRNTTDERSYCVIQPIQISILCLGYWDCRYVPPWPFWIFLAFLNYLN